MSYMVVRFRDGSAKEINGDKIVVKFGEPEDFIAIKSIKIHYGCEEVAKRFIVRSEEVLYLDGEFNVEE